MSAVLLWLASLGPLLVPLPVSEHPVLEPMPGSSLAAPAEVEEEGEMLLSYRGEDGRTRTTVRGRRWSLEYELPPDVSRDAIVDFFEAQLGALEGGRVLRRAGNRLTFRFRRPDGGDSWGELWATDGNYTLEIVDAAPEAAAAPPEEPEPGTHPELPTTGDVSAPALGEGDASNEEARHELLGAIVFLAGSASLPPGAGAVLDAVAASAAGDPSMRLELRGSRTADEPPELAERRTRAVAEALALYGVAPDRIEVPERPSVGAARVEIASVAN